MNCRRSGRLLLSSLVLLSIAAIALETGVKAAPALVALPQVTQEAPSPPNLKIVISLTKAKFDVGEPVILSIAVSSPGGRETIPKWGPLPEDLYWPTVSGHDRESPRLTPHGKASVRGMSTRSVEVEQVGDEPTISVIALHEYYDLSEGGTFDVSVSRRVAVEGARSTNVFSQGVRFQVGAARTDGEKFRLRRPEGPLPESAIDSWGPEQCGLQLAARLRDATILAGDDVIIDVYIRNRSAGDVNLGGNRAYCYTFEVRDSEGRLVDNLPPGVLDLPIGGGPMALVAPGQCLVGTITPPPRYSPDKPGRYTISVSRDISYQCGANWLLETEPFELEVREGAGK